jgi:hypothetical protein
LLSGAVGAWQPLQGTGSQPQSSPSRKFLPQSAHDLTKVTHQQEPVVLPHSPQAALQVHPTTSSPKSIGSHRPQRQTLQPRQIQLLQPPKASIRFDGLAAVRIIAKVKANTKSLFINHLKDCSRQLPPV